MSKKTADDFVEIDKSNYKEYVFVKSPKSKHWKNMMWAFLIGGAICVLGQCFIELYVWLGIVREEASVLASATLVALAAIFTGIGRPRESKIYLRQAGQIRRGGQHNSDYGIFQCGGCACA